MLVHGLLMFVMLVMLLLLLLPLLPVSSLLLTTERYSNRNLRRVVLGIWGIRVLARKKSLGVVYRYYSH